MLKNRIDLRLDLDTRCNLRCRYCDNSSLDPKIKVSFPLEQFKDVFLFAEQNCWSLFLSCAGEPLMNVKFADIMELLRQTVKTPDVSMVTNALALNEVRRSQILSSPIDRLFISMDSLSPEIYTKWCGVSAEQFQRVVENIEAFAEARRKQKKPPHLIVTAIAMKDTLEGLPDIARWLKRLKVSAFNIQWLNSMDHDYLRKEQLDMNDPIVASRVREILSEVQDILEGSGVLLDYPHTVSKEKLKSVWRNRKLWRNKFYYFKDLFFKLTSRRRGLPCRFATNTFYLWPDGHLKGCPADGFETGNIFDGVHTLQSEMKQVSSDIKNGKTPKCDSCLFKVE
ncbi:MAG: radical SAM protein [Fibrobacter sp.]|nr:radical SAM protein [Fibrobacter sp.]